jgi:hypothetical protein
MLNQDFACFKFLGNRQALACLWSQIIEARLTFPLKYFLLKLIFKGESSLIGMLKICVKSPNIFFPQWVCRLFNKKCIDILNVKHLIVVFGEKIFML